MRNRCCASGQPLIIAILIVQCHIWCHILLSRLFTRLFLVSQQYTPDHINEEEKVLFDRQFSLKSLTRDPVRTMQTNCDSAPN